MTDTKSKTETGTKSRSEERFAFADFSSSFAEQGERWLDEMERASRASLEGVQKLVEETRRMSEAQLEVNERLLGITLENARRSTRAFR